MGVDRLCEKTFLEEGAEHRDPNLAPLGKWLRESESHDPVERAALLDLYGQVLSGARPLVQPNEAGRMTPRNRIYQRVFDKSWRRAHAGR